MFDKQFEQMLNIERSVAANDQTKHHIDHQLRLGVIDKVRKRKPLQLTSSQSQGFLKLTINMLSQIAL